MEGEFENVDFESFCDEHEIEHNFSAHITPQQNEIVERKNITLQEMTRTILHENNLPTYFWAEGVNTSCYVLNRVFIRLSLDNTPFELWKNKKPNISYFKVFGSKCFILNTKDNLGNFDAKSSVGIFLRYSLSSNAYRVFNKKTMVVEESVHIVFDESNDSLERGESIDDDVGLDFSMERLQIEDEAHQQEEEIDSKKEKELPLTPNLCRSRLCRNQQNL